MLQVHASELVDRYEVTMPLPKAGEGMQGAHSSLLTIQINSCTPSDRVCVQWVACL